MMQPVHRIDGKRADATSGRPVLDWPKALWNGGMLVGAFILCPLYFSWSAVTLFLVLTYLTLLIGHSVGMHRMMIHRTFETSAFLRRLLIYIGTIVGVAGPFGILRIHDLRDWAQRQPECHPFFAHTEGYWRDTSWNLAYRFEFEKPPVFRIEPSLADDPWIRAMEKTWRWQQLVLALPLFLIGGWGWVAWGICLRVFVSAAGHWSITYFCHNPGPGRWDVSGASVQASNLRGFGLLTYGECWHNNHHAFPESARIGLEPGQWDPAWWLIAAMQKCGLAYNVGEPRDPALREDLVARQLP